MPVFRQIQKYYIIQIIIQYVQELIGIDLNIGRNIHVFKNNIIRNCNSRITRIVYW